MIQSLNMLIRRLISSLEILLTRPALQSIPFDFWRLSSFCLILLEGAALCRQNLHATHLFQVYSCVSILQWFNTELVCQRFLCFPKVPELQLVGSAMPRTGKFLQLVVWIHFFAELNQILHCCSLRSVDECCCTSTPQLVVFSGCLLSN